MFGTEISRLDAKPFNFTCIRRRLLCPSRDAGGRLTAVARRLYDFLRLSRALAFGSHSGCMLPAYSAVHRCRIGAGALPAIPSPLPVAVQKSPRAKGTG